MKINAEKKEPHVDLRTAGKNMLENIYLHEKIQNFLNQQIAQNLLFQMRNESLFNSKKWPSDSSKGFVTPTFWPSHSVKLL